ncbi:MAG: SRPBCC family protein [Actinomycetota bacterium]|nr:SRPBCC family protein [Actinomycetota bacterium]
MKELHARAQTQVNATPEQALALLRAVDGYPTWYPDAVRAAEVLERDDDGRPTKVKVTLHIASGPLVRDFRLTLAVTAPDPETIKLARQPHDASDPERFEVTWRVLEGDGVRIELALDANLSVPRLLPVGGVGESLAQGFVSAAARALS